MDLELKRTAEDRRLYALDGVGTLRLEGLAGRMATAEAGGRAGTSRAGGCRWRIISGHRRRGHRGGRVRAAAQPSPWRRASLVRPRGFELRPASKWRQRYALADGDRELALFDGKGWGRRPVSVSLDDPGELDPGLVLFAAFVVRSLAEDSGGAAAAGA